MPNTRRSARLNPGVLTRKEAQAHTTGPRGPVMSSSPELTPTRASPSVPAPSTDYVMSSGLELTPTRASPSVPAQSTDYSLSLGPELTPTRASSSVPTPSTDYSLSSGPELTPTRAAPTSPPPSPGSAEQFHIATPDTVGTAGQTGTLDPKNPRAGDPAMHEHSSDDESESGPSILDDDGGRRCRLRRPLCCCPEAFTASGQELEESANAAKGKGKGKRKRNKGNYVVRARWGLGRPRDPVQLEDKPIL